MGMHVSSNEIYYLVLHKLTYIKCALQTIKAN